MQTILAALLSCVFLCGCHANTPCGADVKTADPVARLRVGRQLAINGRLEQALREYVWCLECGLEAHPLFLAAYHTSLLQALRDLSLQYPPALGVLRKKQTSLESRIAAGVATTDEMPTFIAVNEALGDQEKSVSTYRSMTRSGSSAAIRHELWYWLVDYLFDLKRFAEIAKETAVSKARLATLEAQVSVSAHVRHPGSPIPRVLRLGAAQYRSLLEVRASEEASMFAEAVIALDASRETFALLIQQAREAHDDDAVSRLLNKARGRLPESDLVDLQGSAAGSASPPNL